MELKNSSLKYTVILFSVLIISVFSSVQADNRGNNQLTTSQAEEVSTAQKTHVRIQQLSNEVNAIRKSLSEIDRQIEFSTYKEDLEKLREQKTQQTELLHEKLESFEQAATGVIDSSTFNEPKNNEFSWHEELKEIFKPLVYELKKLTERPRKIDKLRTDVESLQIQKKIAQSAIDKISTLKNSSKEPEMIENLTTLEQHWLNKFEEISGNLQLLSLQLEEKLENGRPHSVEIVNFLKAFFSGRGLNLLLSVLAFTVTLVTLRFLSHHIEQFISRGRDRERRFFSRLVHVVFQVLAVFFALFSLLATLYTLGDWLLLTIFIIFLIGLALALRNSLPRYLEEVRLLLNIGPVREGERVIYNNLPWRVSRLNIYSDLVNPALTGGRIRIPITELSEMISRRWSRTEPWFPCKPKDFVILNDETYGEVILQTPDIVQIKVFGGSIKTLKTSNFLDLSPKNLSEGFGLNIALCLDYSLQPTITTEVTSILRSDLLRLLDNTPYRQDIISLNIEFNEATLSSLNLLLQITLPGKYAGEYNNIKRFIQKCTIESCNKNNWTIPTNELKIITHHT